MSLNFGATIGIVGGGQLGRMLAFEARRMGFRTCVLAPDGDGPAAQVADRWIGGELNDPDALARLADACDVVTLEWENADPEGLRQIGERVPVHPGPEVLRVAQHRIREKETARRLGLAVPEFAAVSSADELSAGLDRVGTPAVLKTARGGYDGRGQAVIRAPEEAGAAWEALGGARELILEQWIPFRLEVSVVCARDRQGQIVSFAPAENQHRAGVLDTTVAPARISAAMAREAQAVGEALAEGLDVVGLLATEMFITADDRLLVNEIAPRPHNSGHHTLGPCATSQFEQQIRAVCGLPLGSPDLLSPASMANLLGEHLTPQSSAAAALSEPGVTLHLYGKREPRTGRKMGHITAVGGTPDAALNRAVRARAALAGNHDP